MLLTLHICWTLWMCRWGGFQAWRRADQGSVCVEGWWQDRCPEEDRCLQQEPTFEVTGTGPGQEVKQKASVSSKPSCRDWIDGSGVQSLCCSSRGVPSTHIMAHHCLIPLYQFQGIQRPFPASEGTGHGPGTHTSVQENTHTGKNKSK